MFFATTLKSVTLTLWENEPSLNYGTVLDLHHDFFFLCASNSGYTGIKSSFSSLFALLMLALFTFSQTPTSQKQHAVKYILGFFAYPPEKVYSRFAEWER